jgi:cytochrome c556
MVAIDDVMAHLGAIERSGWTTPADHPDLVPAAEAGRLADLLRILQDDEDVRAKPPGFIDALRDGAALATTLEDALLTDSDPTTLTTRLADLRTSCTSCHARYRD